MGKTTPVLISCACVVLFCGFINPSRVIGQNVATADTSGLRLFELINVALEQSPLLQAEKLQVEAMRTRARRSGQLENPQAAVSYQPLPIYTAKGFQRTQWKLEQTIPFPGKRGLEREIARVSTEYAGYSAEALAQEIVLRVSLAFYDMYRVQEQLDLVETYRKQVSDFIEIVTSQYAVGRGAQQDILKAQLERNSIDRLELDLLRQRQSSVETLALLLAVDGPGQFLGRTIQLEDSHNDAIFVTVTERHVRPEIQQLKALQKRRELEIGLANKERYPDFRFGLSYVDIAQSDLTTLMNGRDAFALSLAISVPIWRTKERSKVAEAGINFRQAVARKEALEIEIASTVRDVESQIDVEKRMINLFGDTLIPQGELTLEASLNGYSTGVSDFLNLLNAQQTLFDLRIGFSNSKARLRALEAQLYHATGSIKTTLFKTSN